ncbi:MAG: bifunctional aspartate kinase/homoserine dehydrogenase I [Rikenellaceae bacterium]
MKVLKFGGTSVGTVASLSNVMQIVNNSTEEMVVVVSALGGVTDLLIATANAACAGDNTYTETFDRIILRHEDVISGLVAESQQQELRDRLRPLMDDLCNIYKGIHLIRDLSPKTMDTIVSYGERFSSTIISYILEDVTLIDSREIIKTNPQFAKHIVDFELSNRLITEAFAKVSTRVKLLPGFIASDATSGEITTLGRGGSDYTAAILAAALDAKILEIWTDVDGFMTADPRAISNTYVIQHLSFVEAMELCNFGAKVIYPPTIYPVYYKNIPIVIKNTFNIEAPGTLITREKSKEEGKPIKGISSINDTSLITVMGLGMMGVIGVNYRIFKALAKGGISVFLVSQASSENNISIGVRNVDADQAAALLDKEFASEIELGEIRHAKIERDLATVAIVGDNMKHTPGIAGRLFHILGCNGINVIACAQGASETNISFVIQTAQLRKALNVIHDSFFLSEHQVINLFIAGVGTVGRNLVEQIRAQQPKLLEEKALKVNVVGIAKSKSCIFDRNGIDLDNYETLLANEAQEASPAIIAKEIIDMNIFNSVFVDCTASSDITTIYKDLLSNNVSVVAANKVAASSEYESYVELKEIARKRGVKFLFETNVGAGLPIISTINGLINSGDTITKIEAVVSGTLNFIFNEMSADVTLSKAIKMAQEAGYSEPDPRLDLNGSDVIRKLVILAREAGYQLEQADVIKNLFIPSELFEGSVEDFWANVPKLDEEFEANRQKAEAGELRYRFVAKLEGGVGSVGLVAVDSKHPFYQLEGSNNVVMLTTERYKELPMVIKGYGAGAAVTAAGVFADIISIANIR